MLFCLAVSAGIESDHEDTSDVANSFVMTEDEAQAWLQYRRIRHAWKPTARYAGDARWRCRIMRPTKEILALIIPSKSSVELLRLIAVEAWEEYPTRKLGHRAEKLWQFFSQEELRELAQQDWPTN